MGLLRLAPISNWHNVEDNLPVWQVPILLGGALGCSLLMGGLGLLGGGSWSLPWCTEAVEKHQERQHLLNVEQFVVVTSVA